MFEASLARECSVGVGPFFLFFSLVGGGGGGRRVEGVGFWVRMFPLIPTNSP